MVRGTGFIITDDKVYMTCEFNGGMSLLNGTHGKEFLNYLKDTTDVKDFQDNMIKFDELEFKRQNIKNNNGNLVFEADSFDNPFISTSKKYKGIAYWDYSKQNNVYDFINNNRLGTGITYMSDYTYVKNLSNNTIKLIGKNGIAELKSNDVLLFDGKRISNHNNRYKNCNLDKIKITKTKDSIKNEKLEKSIFRQILKEFGFDIIKESESRVVIKDNEDNSNIEIIIELKDKEDFSDYADFYEDLEETIKNYNEKAAFTKEYKKESDSVELLNKIKRTKEKLFTLRDNFSEKYRDIFWKKQKQQEIEYSYNTY